MTGLTVLVERVGSESKHWQPSLMLSHLAEERDRQMEWAEQELEVQQQQRQQQKTQAQTGQATPKGRARTKGVWAAMTGMRDSMMAKMVSKVLANLRLRISSVHIRMEDSTGCSESSNSGSRSSGVAGGLIIQDLSIQAVDNTADESNGNGSSSSSTDYNTSTSTVAAHDNSINKQQAPSDPRQPPVSPHQPRQTQQQQRHARQHVRVSGMLLYW